MDQTAPQARLAPRDRLVARPPGRCRILAADRARAPFAPPAIEELDPPPAPPPAAPEPAPPPPPRFELDDLARVAAFARMEGMAEARAAAETRLEARLAEAESTLAAGLGRVAAERARERGVTGALATDLALALARAIVPAALARAPLEDLARMVGDCLARLHDAPPLEILVATDLVEPCRLRVEALAREAGYGGPIRVAGDSRLGPGDARITWPEGGARRDLAAIGAEAEALVLRLLPPFDEE